MTHAREKINPVTSLLLILAAFMFDAAQAFISVLHAIPGIGNAVATMGTWFITGAATGIFALCFALLKVNRHELMFWGSALMEMLPVLNALPVWTLSVLLIIFLENAKRTIRKRRLDTVGALRRAPSY